MLVPGLNMKINEISSLAGISLFRGAAVGAGTWLVERVSCYCVEESYKQSVCHGAGSRNFGRRENPRHGHTFRVIVRDRPGRFR